MKENQHVLIMCGGGGTRLWPASTTDCPKPFMKICGEGSLLEQSYQRALKVVVRENIWLVSVKELGPLCEKVLPDLPSENLLLEPQAKNTAAALIYSSQVIQKKCGQAVNLLILASDHFIGDEELFAATATEALEIVEDSSCLLTFGVKPYSAKTEYGYIEAGESLGRNSRAVKRFVEKPDLGTAAEYIQNPDFFWNSGMFCWNTEIFLSEAKDLCPSVSGAFENMKDYHDQTELKAVYLDLENISVDYAIMEKTKKLRLLPANFYWSDVGNWNSLGETGAKDKGENVTIGSAQIVDGEGNVTFSKNKKIVVYGLDNIVAVEGEDAILVTSREKAVDLKKLLSRLNS